MYGAVVHNSFLEYADPDFTKYLLLVGAGWGHEAYHALSTDAQKIAQATRSTFRLADDHKLTSIALPALGTGVGGFPMAEAAEAMLSTLLRHLTAGPTTLQKVIFVIYQDDAYRVFKETLARLTPAK